MNIVLLAIISSICLIIGNIVGKPSLGLLDKLLFALMGSGVVVTTRIWESLTRVKALDLSCTSSPFRSQPSYAYL